MKLRLLAATATLAVSPSVFAQSAADLADIVLGVPVVGSLEASDEVCSRGSHADRYVITGAAGTTIQAQLQSDNFDTYLILEGANGNETAWDDDGGAGTNSRLHFTLPEDGLYTVIATSYSAGTVGTYTLEVDEFQPVPLSPSALTLGEMLEGRLEDGDAVAQSHGYVDAFNIEAGIGVEIEVMMESRDFDTFLYLIGPTGERVTSDDDGGFFGTNSRIQYTTQAAGQYRVLATSYGGYAQGAYTLRTAEGFGATTDAIELTLGAEVTGTLTATEWGDDFAYEFGPGNEGDRYTIALDAGEQVVFEMRSDAVDSYLRLLSPEGYDLTSDDDSGEGLNARLAHMIGRSGTYTVMASALSGGAGTYTLSATTEEPIEVTTTELTYGEGVSGTLTSGDARGVNGGGYVDPFSFEGTAGDRVDISLTTDPNSMTPNIRVFSPLGEEFGYMSRGFDGGYRSLVLPYTGEYRITVGAYDTADHNYTLTIRDAQAPAELVSEPIEIGATVAGTLDSDDAMDATRGAYADSFVFTVEEAGLFAISMNSEVIDGYLELHDANDVVAANDDAVGLNPAIRQFLVPGEYRISATQFSLGEGEYTLTIEEAGMEPLVVEFVTPGDHIAGHLSRSDTVSQQLGSPADYYRMEVGGGQPFTLTMTSESVDPVISVLDEFGEQIAFNDDSGDGSLNAHVIVVPATSGVLTIVAGGYDAREGTYELHVAEGAIEADVGPVQ